MKGLWVFVLSLGTALPAWARVDREPGIGLPRDISLEGHRIDWLLWVTTGMVTLLFIIMCIWMAIAVVRHNHKHTPDYDHGTSKHSMWMAIGVSVLVFLVVDGTLFYKAVIDMDEAFWNWGRAQTPDTVRIEVLARQWAWEARYPGADGRFGTEDDVVTLNDIRVPSDRPVAIQLAAVDVIHSFYLPNLRVKTDAVPGMVNHLWFQVDGKKLADSGSNQFDIACAQHCGTHHYKMKGVLTVYNGDQFAAWSEEASINGKLDYDAREEGTFSPHWGWAWETI